MTDPITHAIAHHLDDLEPEAVHSLDTFLLGSIDGHQGVQPGDLETVVEVVAPPFKHATIDRRLRQLFNVLGTRRVKDGTAYACVVPPTIRPAVSSAIVTIALRRSHPRSTFG